MSSKALVAAAVLAVALAASCLSRTPAPVYAELEGQAVPAQVTPRYEGQHKIWEFRIVLANNTGQDMRLRDYDVSVLDTDTGYTSSWNVVPAKETVIRAYSGYGYTTDYRTISRFHRGRQHRVYHTVGVRDGTEHEVGFDVELLN